MRAVLAVNRYTSGRLLLRGWDSYYIDREGFSNLSDEVTERRSSVLVEEERVERSGWVEYN